MLCVQVRKAMLPFMLLRALSIIAKAMREGSIALTREALMAEIVARAAAATERQQELLLSGTAQVGGSEEVAARLQRQVSELRQGQGAHAEQIRRLEQRMDEKLRRVLALLVDGQRRGGEGEGEATTTGGLR